MARPGATTGIPHGEGTTLDENGIAQNLACVEQLSRGFRGWLP